mmetsp:Transcript_45076/g.94206  ORF Transcript_45076/g.94206 Transcript_45076/m.94206 type:complete len:94 (+) Transcript_45076:751-1032(+)
MSPFPAKKAGAMPVGTQIQCLGLSTEHAVLSAASDHRQKNPRRIPEKWNNVVPLWLLNWRESQRWAKFKKQKREKEKQERLAKRAAEREAATA